MLHPRLPQLLADAKCEGWAHFIRSELDERALLDGYRVQIKLGYRAAWFATKYCRHSKGDWAGKPLIFSEFQLNRIVIPLYGWVHRDTGLRRFRTIFILMPQKNGKSTLAAFCGLYGLAGDLEPGPRRRLEPGAEIYAAANDKNQAQQVFGEAMRMVYASPELRRLLRVYKGTKTILRDEASWFKALPCNEASAEGKNTYVLIVDEIHAFTRRAAGTFDALRYTGRARKQPLTIIITTAGEEESGPGYQEYQYAKGVDQGTNKTDIRYLSVLCEADRKDEWTSELVWRQANPHLGITIRLDDMRADAERAKIDAGERRRFLRRRLNRWINVQDEWLDFLRWKDQARPFDAKDIADAKWFVGLDLSATTDLTACVLLGKQWRRGAEPMHWCKSWFFLPDDRIEKLEREDGLEYRELAREGWIHITQGNAVDYAFIEKKVVEVAGLVTVSEVAYDRWSALPIIQHLKQQHGMRTAEIPQDIRNLSAPSKELDRLIRVGLIADDGNPILLNHVMRARVYTDVAGNIRPVKGGPNRKRSKIDGLIALLNGLARGMVARPPVQYAGSGVSRLA